MHTAVSVHEDVHFSIQTTGKFNGILRVRPASRVKTFANGIRMQRLARLHRTRLVQDKERRTRLI